MSTVHALSKFIAAAVITPRWSMGVNATVVSWVHAVTELM